MRKTFLLLGIILSFQALCQQQKTISFGFDESLLTTAAQAELETLASLNIKKIELYGHCDGKGSDEYNDKLSLQRIKSVKQYLVSKGVSTSVFSKENGLGKRQPLNDNVTESERAANRRVLIVYEIVPVAETGKAPQPAATKPLTISLETALKDSSVTTGTSIVLQNLNFIGGRHVLLPSSIPVLENLLATMKKYPSLKIEILGHICCLYDGTDGLDNDLGTKDLSYQRAGAVYKYLVDNGINAARMSFKGMGSSQPIIYPEKNEEDMTRNRRVEIRIISK